MLKKSILAVLIIVLLGCVSQTMRAQQRYVIGIMPVYDQSAEELTEFLPNGLAMLLFKHLRASTTMNPVLLSAGGLYDPSSTDWNLEYGRKAHVDALLLARIYKSTRLNDRKSRLKYSLQVMNVATGALGPEITNDTIEIATASLIESFDKKTGAGASAYISSKSFGFFRSSEDFEKQPLGKAAAKLADWTIDQLPAALTAQGTKETGSAAVPAAATPCPVVFKVRFVAKHSVAKGYSIFADDQDESSTVSDGVGTFSIPGGPVAFRVEIPDPPYGMPTQKLYQSSTIVTCGGPQKTLNMDVGPAGEAILRWE
jgi:hypothetical protein